jgi:hypothetical protein
MLGSVVLLLSTVLVLGPGRAGLPADVYSEAFRFAAATDRPGRILLFGPVERLPGESRTIDGLGYRLLIPPYPRSWEAELNEPRLGDQALEALLRSILDGEQRRAGSALAEFGISWVAFIEPSSLELVFESQLDLVPLHSLDFPVFRNEDPAVVARSSDGTGWIAAGTGFVAPPTASGSVRVAVNADERWGPGTWDQDDWANLIAGSDGAVNFSGHSGRRMLAIASAAWAALLAAVWLASRRGGRS